MNESGEELLTQIHRLAVRQHEGELSEDERAEFHRLLDDPAARRTYLKYMQDTASLRWLNSGHWRRLAGLAASPGDGSGPPGRRRSAMWSVGTAATVLVGAAILFSNLRDNDLAERRGRDSLASAGPTAGAKAERDHSHDNVATVTVLSGVKWDGQSKGAGLLGRVAIGKELKFDAGVVELTFDTGAQVKLFGPASVRISSARSILCSRGRVTTLVGESGKGFTIDTPKARIVDLGTQFGVNISEKGDTQVVVFQGAVDLSPSGDKSGDKSGADADLSKVNRRRWTKRLRQGEAMLLDDTGSPQRAVAVKRSDFFPTTPADGIERDAPVILDVRDNIRAGESNKCYQIVRGLREDAPCFVDREHEWNGIGGRGLPEFLVDAEYIMPFNDDKFISDLRVEVQISRPADLYVFLDENMKPPAWLRKSFKDTGVDIGLDGAQTVWHRDHALAQGAGNSVDFTFSVWRREVDQPGFITLGGVDPPEVGSRSSGFNMYGIAVVPK